MRIINFILSYFKKTKEQRIRKLVLKLVNEVDFYCTGNNGVNNVNIWFDYDSQPKREIELRFESLTLAIKTDKKSTNYKK